MKWAANLDMYRKVPLDLLEGSRQGSAISWIALLVMISLFVLETRDYLTARLATDLALDRSRERRIRVNFNITMMDLRCEYATIDVVSVLGKEQNVTKNVRRWTVDANGVQQQFVHRNLLQHDIHLHDEDVTESLEDLHANGQDAVDLDAETLQYALHQHSYVFVDFFAGWCSHCQALAPTWEKLAEIMADTATERVHRGDYEMEEYEEAKKLETPVLIGKVDCVAHHDLCMEYGIMGYPTLRLFVNGKKYSDYWGHRTILSMVEFLSVAAKTMIAAGDEGINHARDVAGRTMNLTEDERTWAAALEKTRHRSSTAWNPQEHPGCQLSGVLLMDRAPGHFYIQAYSQNVNIAPHMTNVSHEIHDLSFGDSKLMKQITQHHKTTDLIPSNYEESTKPLNGNVYITKELHSAYHHYLKLVPTNVHTYQVMQSSQLALYQPDKVPEAKFVVDLSPISISYRRADRHWYDYVVSVLAIVGGTFTIVGMFESALRATTRKNKRSIKQTLY